MTTAATPAAIWIELGAHAPGLDSLIRIFTAAPVGQIPEPGTLGLMLLALPGLAMMRRYRARP